MPVARSESCNILTDYGADGAYHLPVRIENSAWKLDSELKATWAIPRWFQSKKSSCSARTAARRHTAQRP